MPRLYRTITLDSLAALVSFNDMAKRRTSTRGVAQGTLARIKSVVRLPTRRRPYTWSSPLGHIRHFYVVIDWDSWHVHDVVFLWRATGTLLRTCRNLQSLCIDPLFGQHLLLNFIADKRVPRVMFPVRSPRDEELFAWDDVRPLRYTTHIFLTDVEATDYFRPDGAEGYFPQVTHVAISCRPEAQESPGRVVGVVQALLALPRLQQLMLLVPHAEDEDLVLTPIWRELIAGVQDVCVSALGYLAPNREGDCMPVIDQWKMFVQEDDSFWSMGEQLYHPPSQAPSTSPAASLAQEIDT